MVKRLAYTFYVLGVAYLIFDSNYELVNGDDLAKGANDCTPMHAIYY